MTSRLDSQINFSRELKSYFLDLTNPQSIKAFIENVSNANYQGIISLLGETSGLGLESSLSDKANYYITHCANYFHLLEQLALSKNIMQESGHLLVLGSRASEYGSFDSHYAAAKAALIGFCRSISRKNRSRNITCVIPSLIIGSNMSNAMSKEVIDSHIFRAQDGLLNVETASKAIWQIFTDIPRSENLRLNSIGPSYF